MITTTLQAVLDKLLRRSRRSELPPDIDPAFVTIYDKTKHLSMVTWERLYSLYLATKYINKRKIPGDFVECGVWRGGCCLVMLETLLQQGDTNRDLYVYDTFTGMASPEDGDATFTGQAAEENYKKMQSGDRSDRCCATLDDVKNNLDSTGYSSEKIHYVKGLVEETLPQTIPDQLALLRLDTDWYASTYHELVHLYPRLVSGGVLIIDDYGHWQGSRKAVEQYFIENNITLFLSRVECSAVGIKM